MSCLFWPKTKSSCLKSSTSLVEDEAKPRHIVTISADWVLRGFLWQFARVPSSAQTAQEPRGKSDKSRTAKAFARWPVVFPHPIGPKVIACPGSDCHKVILNSYFIPHKSFSHILKDFAIYPLGLGLASATCPSLKSLLTSRAYRPSGAWPPKSLRGRYGRKQVSTFEPVLAFGFRMLWVSSACYSISQRPWETP
jgi:hypothetical protein